MSDKSQETKLEQLNDEQLEQANGGIIGVLIGLAKEPKQPGGANILLGDGSVRQS